MQNVNNTTSLTLCKNTRDTVVDTPFLIAKMDFIGLMDILT